MSAAEKGFYFRRLKEAGVEMDRHYREYTTEELKYAHEIAVNKGVLEEVTPEELKAIKARAHQPKTKAEKPEPRVNPDEEPAPASFYGYPEEKPAPDVKPPVRPDMGEMAGERLNTKAPEEIIRVDEEGRQWLQEEVLKPAYPKPRGRRVLRYNDPGTRTETVKAGDYTETFEVAGDPKNATPSEIKITLPSYQVGIYRDKRFPFKVITYNGKSGFDRLEVEAYYGGPELVPPVAKRTYVENVLCYDMRSVIRAINEEYRALQLSGRV